MAPSSQELEPPANPARFSLHMVSVPENEDTISIIMSLRHAVTGLLRSPIGMPENIASAFFNAGVELLRAGVKNQSAYCMRAVVHGIGLIFALRSSDDLVEAFVVNDGAQNLVNLLGSFVDLTEQGTDEALVSKIGTVIGCVQLLVRRSDAVSEDKASPLEPRNTRRIEGSIKRLQEAGIEPAGSESENDLANAVMSATNAIAAMIGVTQTVRTEDDIDVYVNFVHAAYTKILPLFMDDIGLDPRVAARIIADNLTTFIHDAMSNTGDTFERLRRLYREPLKNGAGSIAKVGPMVAVGLMDIEKWKKVEDAALGLTSDANLETAFKKAFSDLRSRSVKPNVDTVVPESTSSSLPNNDMAEIDPHPWEQIKQHPQLLQFLMQNPQFLEMIKQKLK